MFTNTNPFLTSTLAWPQCNQNLVSQGPSEHLPTLERKWSSNRVCLFPPSRSSLVRISNCWFQPDIVLLSQIGVFSHNAPSLVTVIKTLFLSIPVFCLLILLPHEATELLVIQWLAQSTWLVTGRSRAWLLAPASFSWRMFKGSHHHNNTLYTKGPTIQILEILINTVPPTALILWHKTWRLCVAKTQITLKKHQISFEWFKIAHYLCELKPDYTSQHHFFNYQLGNNQKVEQHSAS